MGVWSWMRALSRRQVAGLLLLATLLVIGATMPNLIEGPTPSSGESHFVGWQDPADADDLAREVFARVNDERAARGSPPLAWDEDLAELARGWSAQMIDTGAYEHSPDSYRQHPRFAGVGENIALGQRTSAELHVGWMRSEGHRHNILDPDFDAVGIGIVCRNDGAMWATQLFGRYEPGPPRTPVDRREEPVTRQDRGLRCPGPGERS